MNVAGEKYGNCTVLETDAEDSSYDSDFEGEDSVGSTSFHSQGDLQVCNSEHPNASRTASDTLAAEFAEYVTVQGNPTTQSPGYMARVEFALKLGYTEQLVQTALEKLGPDPEQNELLAELIKLGASCSQKLLDTVEDPNNVFDADFGSNKDSGQSSKLRPIVIDGSNVAMSHGNKEVFSCRGIKICVDWFRSRGHKEITVFVPKWRKEASRIDNPIADQEILGELERDRLLVFTPSRLIGGKRMICYDDRYILKLAAEIDGVVVSNDNYRDLAQENSEFRRVIEKRILMYTFVNDRFMPPDDPLGRTGPTLDNFLKASPTKSDPVTPCPYAKKCTYGNKCKFRHPERDLHPQKSVTEKLEEHVQKHLNVKGSNNNLLSFSTPSAKHKPLCKTRSMIPSGNEQSLSSIMESKSAENIGTDQSANPLRQGTPQLPATSCSQGFRSSHRSAGRTGKPEAEQNLHKKLQRQLTLNPSSMASPDLKHKPLTRHCSNELPHKTSMSCDRSEPGQQHHHVTRMASAPESFQSWTQNNPNVDLPPSSSTQQQVVTDAQMIRNSLHSGLYDNFYPDMLREFLDLRTEAYNFLVDLFPEGLVRLVMLIHPFELDEITLLFAIRKILRRQQLQQ